MLLLIGQFRSPIILILIVAALLAFFLHDRAEAIIILVIVVASGVLSFVQEHRASDAVRRLLALVQVKTTVVRDGRKQEVPVEDVVPGDVLVLSAGDVIPADCRILDSRDFHADEAALTGESFAVEKQAGVLPVETPLSHRTNSLFMGSHCISGTARAVAVRTGRDTEFGRVSERLRLRPAETEFEHGVRRFGYFLAEVTLLLVIAIFAINVFLHRPVLQSFLFALALAVGLTPQLLPAIISINLAHGARQMADRRVIVKRLAAIENFGSMNVLCADKTGTLTEGRVGLQAALDAQGRESERVLFHAYLNAALETGFTNPLDEAIRSLAAGKQGHHPKRVASLFSLTGYQKLDEIPYDFHRRRLSILVRGPDGVNLMITKGAFANVLEACTNVETGPDSESNTKAQRHKEEPLKTGTPPEAGSVPIFYAPRSVQPLSMQRAAIEARSAELAGQGFRVLAVAVRANAADTINRDAEIGMTLLGLLVLSDPPKPGIEDTIARLRRQGVALKIITGDNKLVAAHLSRQIGLAGARILTGADIHALSDEALRRQVNESDVFAEVEPNHKERIILALRKAGNVVGFLGDGINDASALHAADVSISVSSAVDVAKEAADIVLLDKDLNVLSEGVQAGRTCFANTLKYVFMATSANFGNMFSMAGASLFLPFLPLLPGQILLTNLLTDFPEMTIATDRVDPELLERPRRWDVRFIRNFMLLFGPVSSLFDFLTFGMLAWLLHAPIAQFRTGWFIESVVSAAFVVLVIRSRRPFFRSRPGKYLLRTTLAVAAVTVALPYTPLGALFGFQPLPLLGLAVIAVIVLFYAATAEIVKHQFYAHERR
jgi:Mg2+-importing ATPase